MDDQHVPPTPHSYEPPLDLPPPTPTFPSPYSEAPPIPAQPAFPSQSVMQWEQKVSGPVVGSAAGPAALPDPSLPMTFAGKPPKKRGLVMAMISISVLLILGVGGVFAYTVWNQTPEKVIADSMMNFLKAKTMTFKGNYTYEGKQGTLGTAVVGNMYKLTIDGKGTTNTGEVYVTYTSKIDKKQISLGGSGIFDKDGNLYFRIEKVAELLLSQGIDQSLLTAIDPLIKKIDNKWIKISKDDIEGVSKGYSKNQTCVQDAMKRFEDDQASMSEVATVYKDNAFIVIDTKLGSENGSVGYRIKGDSTKLKSFVKNLNETKLFKDLQKCDAKSYTLKPDDIGKATTPEKGSSETFEIWIDEKSHEITKLTGTSDNKTSKQDFVFEPIFNGAVSVTTPKDALPLKDLIEQIQTAWITYYTQSSNSALRTQAVSTIEDNTKKL